jgi:maleylacetate reductase
MHFVHQGSPTRVVFGAGSLGRLAEEVSALGARRTLIVCTPRRRKTAEAIADALGPSAAGVHARAVPHVPIERAAAARTEARRSNADCCVALGGGSAVGLAKAVALEQAVTIVALPTTYAGSEMTPIWGITEDAVKRTGRDARVLPRTVIYDPVLTVGLPPSVSGASGLNAVAHSVEALYAANASPMVALVAEESIRVLAQALPTVVAAPDDLEARAQALYGAWLAGTALAGADMGLHHKLCHLLGGRFGLPHAATHAALLPHVAAFNRGAASEAMARIARALGADDAAAGLYDLAVALGASATLAELGLAEADIASAAAAAAAFTRLHPRPASVGELGSLLEDAYHGRRPGPDPV